MAAASGAEAQAVLDELSNEIDRLNKENAALRQRVQLLTHRLFGRRSEKGVPVIEQGVLPLELAAAGPVPAATTDESPRDETAEPASLRRRHHGRRRLPDLPRERIEVVPPASARHCTTCDTAKVRIGSDITEKLDYVPASFVIREYVRPKYACGRCQQGVVQAVLPARPIEKGRPGPGLLAHVVSSKYADHLPLYRLEQIFERHGVQITRRTLSEWNGAVADLLEPPYTGSRCASRRGFNATTRPWMCRTRVARQRFGPGICGSIGASWARWCTILPGRAIVTGR